MTIQYTKRHLMRSAYSFIADQVFFPANVRAAVTQSISTFFFNLFSSDRMSISTRQIDRQKGRQVPPLKNSLQPRHQANDSWDAVSIRNDTVSICYRVGSLCCGSCDDDGRRAVRCFPQAFHPISFSALGRCRGCRPVDPDPSTCRPSCPNCLESTVSGCVPISFVSSVR